LRCQRPSLRVFAPRLLAPAGTFLKVTLWRLSPRQTHLTMLSCSTVTERAEKKLSLTATFSSGGRAGLSAPSAGADASAAAKTAGTTRDALEAHPINRDS
jgi:hypothetical protein